MKIIKNKKIVYFAGSVSSGNHETQYDWRTSVFDDYFMCYAADRRGIYETEFTYYSGPYLIDDHCWYNEDLAKDLIKQINRAEVVFAWFDKMDCYGTMFELGYAKALGKPVYAYYRQDIKAILPVEDGDMICENYDHNHWIMHAFTEYCGYACTPMEAYLDFLNRLSR